MQVPGAGVIAQSLPGMQHRVQVRRRQVFNMWPAVEEFPIIGRYRRRGSLLQHDFADPDVIRLGLLAGLCAPREFAAVTIIPVEQKGSR